MMYRGVEIDGYVFRTKADVDIFLEEETVKAYKIACELFDRKPSYEHAKYIDDQAERLVGMFGYTWDQVEAIGY